MIILDTNVVSALMRPRENAMIVEWLNRHPSQDIWTTSINLLEVRYGLLRMPIGKTRASLTEAFDELLSTLLAERVLPFGQPAAERTAEVTARLHSQGNNIDAPDSQIAGIALSRQATLATRNIRDFVGTGLTLVDPWSA